jgi:23S rRNA (adenine2503-C2)-methyltransferase
VEELVERAESYARTTAYPTQYQWTLIEGVNDSDAELERIAQLLSGKYAIMNFIPFNEVDGLDYRRPSPERTAYMVGFLKQRGILARLRDSAGQEVEGACGQLRARREGQRSEPTPSPMQGDGGDGGKNDDPQLHSTSTPTLALPHQRG